jgi:hypothetical protein
MGNAYRILDRKPRGKRSFGRPRHRYEDNIKFILKNTEYRVVNWINLV